MHPATDYTKARKLAVQRHTLCLARLDEEQPADIDARRRTSEETLQRDLGMLSRQEEIDRLAAKSSFTLEPITTAPAQPVTRLLLDARTAW